MKLTNVNIKPNAFDGLKLPFRLVHGHIGSINASVPWLNIYTEPIVIEISDIFAVIVPNNRTFVCFLIFILNSFFSNIQKSHTMKKMKRNMRGKSKRHLLKISSLSKIDLKMVMSII